MRYAGKFDESKIIKKGSENQITSQPIENKQTIKINSNESIESNKIQELNKNSKSQNVNEIKKDFPVFVYEQNIHTKQVEVKNSFVKNDIKLNISKDNLQIMNVNNQKNIIEIQLELEILKTLLISSEPNLDFYKSKFDYLSKELIFLEKKDQIIKDMLKK